MSVDAGEPAPPSALPSDVADGLSRLNEEEIRAGIDYAQQRRQYVHPDMTGQIEPAPGEEIVSIEDQPAYTLVVKRQPCPADCPDCPHGPFLYHVREERRPDGDATLRWTYLGPVES